VTRHLSPQSIEILALGSTGTTIMNTTSIIAETPESSAEQTARSHHRIWRVHFHHLIAIPPAIQKDDASSRRRVPTVIFA
jgi:hypothetical protein